MRSLLVLVPVLALAACASQGATGDDPGVNGVNGATSSSGPDESTTSSSGASSSGASSSGASSSGSSSGASSSSGSTSSSGGSSSGGSSSGGTSSGGSSSSSSSSSSGGSSSGGSSSGGDAGSDASPPPPSTPWDASPCTGAAIDTPSVLTHFAPAATTTTFGTVWADARKRQCQDQTGCQGWQTATSADLYKINWTGSGFTFINPTTLNVPGTGSITCTVPGPNCTLTIGAMTSNVYPAEQGRPLGITPRVAGAQVQVGNWSSNPNGNYLQYSSSEVTTTCLWGSMSGRVYGASGTYVETQLVVWGAF